jgi:hypothetical protein
MAPALHVGAGEKNVARAASVQWARSDQADGFLRRLLGGPALERGRPDAPDGRVPTPARGGRYWGDGYTIESPPNILDMWTRIFAG